MAMGKRKRPAKQASIWVATRDLPRSAAHPFYARLNQILDEHDFDGFVERLREWFYADEGRFGLAVGSLLPIAAGRLFRGAGRRCAIAWRAADSFALRDFLGLVLPEAPPDHWTISGTRRLIDLETHEAVFHLNAAATCRCSETDAVGVKFTRRTKGEHDTLTGRGRSGRARSALPVRPAFGIRWR